MVTVFTQAPLTSPCQGRWLRRRSRQNRWGSYDLCRLRLLLSQPTADSSPDKGSQGFVRRQNRTNPFCPTATPRECRYRDILPHFYCSSASIQKSRKPKRFAAFCSRYSRFARNQRLLNWGARRARAPSSVQTANRVAPAMRMAHAILPHFSGYIRCSSQRKRPHPIGCGLLRIQ